MILSINEIINKIELKSVSIKLFNEIIIKYYH